MRGHSQERPRDGDWEGSVVRVDEQNQQNKDFFLFDPKNGPKKPKFRADLRIWGIFGLSYAKF